MPWTATVPFPAEDLRRCDGCPAMMGWIENAKTGKRLPVEAKGWHGVRIPKKEPGAKCGYTLDGQYAWVKEPAADLTGTPLGDTVVFENHFAFCPKADRFGRRS